ncbi:MurR/RpiR family transcriptional regulator [Clostridium sp. CF012]|uniref:MurR/RpiR family transcriptional regulator n=1 Tax=Clostridium sp. CF012 TaxID=2843319 RepID=UPI001C0CC802|nr:hypothetical protein [Clostridium sp. CF012]MBU3142815.1 hypothetical protein [Clostridium sp. CF012]
MEIFFKKLLLKRASLSNLETQVLNYFLKYHEKILTANIETLSNDMYVSTATISRTCKKLGYSGFQELRYSLNQYKQNEYEKNNHIIHKDNDINDHISRFNNEMKCTLMNIDSSQLNIATSYLLKYYGDI